MIESFGVLGTLKQLFSGISGVFNTDSWDLFWYNNQDAIGSQIYPMGLEKYYDLYSLEGYYSFLWNYTVTLFCTLISPLLPIDKIVMLITLDLSDWVTAFFIIDNPIAYWVCSLIKCKLNSNNNI